jgi:hypothetical protein
MAATSRDKSSEVLDGLQSLIDAGKVADVEEVLTTLVESEPEEDETDEQRETRTYAEGMRDGLALARRMAPEADQ